MLSTYCMVKLFRKAVKEKNKEDIKSEDGNGRSSTNKCRICLKENGSIPIFSEDGSQDLTSAIRTIGDIHISDEDEFPKHLCESCHKLLESALIFRKTAKLSEQILTNKQKKTDSKSPAAEIIPRNEGNEEFSLIDKYIHVLSDDELFNDTTTLKKRKIPKVQCQICFKIVTKAYYKEHFALHDPSVSKYMCDICGKSFRHRCAYRTHRLTHSTSFPYKCNICPYRARHSGLLKTHMRTHTGDYRYMCTECPARFLTKSNLNKHTLKHKEPTFKCDICKRAFHSKLMMERHFEADHLNIKNHICDQCGKAFGYRKAMMRHQIYVHKREKRVNGRMPSYLEMEYQHPETISSVPELDTFSAFESPIENQYDNNSIE